MEEFLTVKELAKRWKVSEKKVYEMVKADDPIPHYRFKGSIRFKLADLEAYEQTHKRGGATA